MSEIVKNEQKINSRRIILRESFRIKMNALTLAEKNAVDSAMKRVSRQPRGKSIQLIAERNFSLLNMRNGYRIVYEKNGCTTTFIDLLPRPLPFRGRKQK